MTKCLVKKRKEVKNAKPYLTYIDDIGGLWLEIDHQSFKLEDRPDDEDSITKFGYQKWFKKMLDIALDRMIEGAKNVSHKKNSKRKRK